MPGLNGFAGEFLILLGMFQRAWADSPPRLAAQLMTIAVLAVSGVVLGAWYMLWLVQRVFFGPLKEPYQPAITKFTICRSAKSWPSRRSPSSSSGSAFVPAIF